MKYFIDTEFIEGFHKPLFGKRRTRDAYIYNMLAKEIVTVTGKGMVKASNFLFDKNL